MKKLVLSTFIIFLLSIAINSSSAYAMNTQNILDLTDSRLADVDVKTIISDVYAEDEIIAYTSKVDDKSNVTIKDTVKNETIVIDEGFVIGVKNKYVVYLKSYPGTTTEDPETELFSYSLKTKEKTLICNFAKFKYVHDPFVMNASDKFVKIHVSEELDDGPNYQSETWSCKAGKAPVLLSMTGAAGKGSMWIYNAAKQKLTIKLGKSKKIRVLVGFLRKIEIKSLVLPKGLKTIPKNAFVQVKNVSKIYIPASVTTIRKKAFNKVNDKTVIYVKKSKAKKLKKAIRESGINKKIKIKTY
jgi:hypothetical protein